MTTQYTMDVLHTTLLTSENNKFLVSGIKNLILDDVGLANLNKAISNQEVTDAILEHMVAITGRRDAWRKYLFNERTGEHIFLLHSSRTETVPTKIKDMFNSIPKDRTSIRFNMDEKLFILRVNSRFYPLSGSTKITFPPSVMNSVFNGPMFIRRVSKDRYTEDSREVWSMKVEAINASIATMVEVIYQDIKRYWNKSRLSPPDSLFISDNLLENIHTLMVLVSVNHNILKFEPRRYDDSMVLEALDTAYSKYGTEKYALDFTTTAIYIVGKLLERLVTSDYQHLLKGFLKCKKQLKSA